jgi:hypothetical protein
MSLLKSFVFIDLKCQNHNFPGFHSPHQGAASPAWPPVASPPSAPLPRWSGAPCRARRRPVGRVGRRDAERRARRAARSSDEGPRPRGFGRQRWGYGSFTRGTPQIFHFHRIFHYKPSILGYPIWGNPISPKQSNEWDVGTMTNMRGWSNV